MISYVSFEYVLELHEQLVREYGGVQGILNEGLLRSALEMPKARFGGKDLHRTIYDKTAAYLFHLIQNHPFVDGNKRTASMVALLFFTQNVETFFILQQDYEGIILGIAQGKVTKKQVAQFFRQSKSTHDKK